jgi:hypothetical protein
MRNILCVITIVLVAGTAFARDFIKFTDQNGVEIWLNDRSKTPPPFPKYYKYVDKNGMTFWANEISKVPKEYVIQVSKNVDGTDKSKIYSENESVAKRQFSTRISIRDNQIIVPVTLTNRKKKVKAKMILDTGASVTTLYSVLASDLKLNKNGKRKKKRVKSISANGPKTDSLLTKIDFIEVDGKILANPEVVIMPAHTNIGADGLLGNSYLRFFNFTIDYEKQLLRWN